MIDATRQADPAGNSRSHRYRILGQRVRFRYWQCRSRAQPTLAGTHRVGGMCVGLIAVWNMGAGEPMAVTARSHRSAMVRPTRAYSAFTRLYAAESALYESVLNVANSASLSPPYSRVWRITVRPIL